MEDRWVRRALIAQILLFGYYQFIEWVNVFPWNDIRGGNGQETLDLIVGSVLLVLIALTAFRLWWLMLAGCVLYAYWVWLQIDSWWVPYVMGASPLWKRVYARNFAATAKFLPVRGDHLPPDAAHVVMQLLIMGALVASLIAALRIRSGRRSRMIARGQPRG